MMCEGRLRWSKTWEAKEMIRMQAEAAVCVGGSCTRYQPEDSSAGWCCREVACLWAELPGNAGKREIWVIWSWIIWKDHFSAVIGCKGHVLSGCIEIKCQFIFLFLAGFGSWDLSGPRVFVDLALQTMRWLKAERHLWIILPLALGW